MLLAECHNEDEGEGLIFSVLVDFSVEFSSLYFLDIPSVVNQLRRSRATSVSDQSETCHNYIKTSMFCSIYTSILHSTRRHD